MGGAGHTSPLESARRTPARPSAECTCARRSVGRRQPLGTEVIASGTCLEAAETFLGVGDGWGRGWRPAPAGVDGTDLIGPE